MAEQPLDQKENDYLWPNCAKKIWPLNDDIVISGIAGRFPQSDNIDELAANLLNKIDMVTQDDSRWPIGKLFFISNYEKTLHSYFYFKKFTIESLNKKNELNILII